jgi:transcriptional regulator with XRE-family HTH domain
MTLEKDSPEIHLFETSPLLSQDNQGDDTGRRRPPIGQLLRNLRGDRTLREVEQGANIPNSYLSNVENGAKRPGVKTLSKLANYFQVPLEELLQVSGLPHTDNNGATTFSALDIHRSFDFLMADPALSQYQKPKDQLSTDTQRFIVELYQHYTGKSLL